MCRLLFVGGDGGARRPLRLDPGSKVFFLGDTGYNVRQASAPRLPGLANNWLKSTPALIRRRVMEEKREENGMDKMSRDCGTAGPKSMSKRISKTGRRLAVDGTVDTGGCI